MMTEAGSPIKDISVAILSCNRKAELQKTLNILHAEGAPWKEIIVADNVSQDGTQSMVKDVFPEVHLIELKENKGVQGINRAYAEASGKWVLSLDDDSAPDMASWTGLLPQLKQAEEAAVISLSIAAESTGSVSTEQSNNTDTAALVPTFGFSQAGSLFNKQALDELGGYDERLFLWSVELHWTAKAIANGWPLMRSDSARVVHRSTALNRSSRRHAYYYCRNMLLFLLLYCPQTLLKQLMQTYINNALKYSALHRTSAYWSAIREASQLVKTYAPGTRLTEDQFQAINPDLKAPFSYLG